MHSFLIRDNEKARITDTLTVMKEMNERIEMLSRQILQSVGTNEAKLTAELYDTMLSSVLIHVFNMLEIKIIPKIIIENEDLISFMSYSAPNYRGNIIAGVDKDYSELRNKLLIVLDKYGFTTETYLLK